MMKAKEAQGFFQSIMSVSLTNVSAGWLSGIVYEDRREFLRKASLNLSLILLNGKLPHDKIYENAKDKEKKITVDPDETNLFITFLPTIFEDKNSMESIVKALSLMVKSEEHFPMACSLLWTLVQNSPVFVDFMLCHADLSDVIMPMLSFLVQGKDDVKKHGSINLAIFILLSLSSKRQFGVSLNNALQTSKYNIPKIRLEHESTLADAVIVVVENVVASHKLSELNECLLTILCNISPYQKTLSKDLISVVLFLISTLVFPSSLKV